ncbi:hypothetical protein OAU50_07395 [Planctomycetota bacterium]|nr:hypothetical protein [Planctomycetota bacterium]
MMEFILYLLPACVIGGMVMGVAGSRDFKRGLIRGGVNSLFLAGGMIALVMLVQLATNPAVI